MLCQWIKTSDIITYVLVRKKLTYAQSSHHGKVQLQTPVYMSVGLASVTPKLINYRVVLLHTPDSGLTDL